MKLAITSYQDAANARILEGTVDGLDIDNNTATVIVDSASISDVPIHYWCHHSTDNHGASRVFKQDDIVLLLYTGNGAAVSNSNVVLVGLKDEIRRCRSTAGILFSLANESVLINSTAIDGDKVEKPTLNVAGQTVTCRAMTGQLVSIEAQSNFRYSGATGNNIYFDGILWDTCPYTVNGAAILGSDVVAVTQFGVYSRPLDKKSAWVQILAISHDIRNYPFFFSADGTKAVSCDGDGNIFDIVLSGAGYSITATPTLQQTGEHTAGYNLKINAAETAYDMTQCLYADMQDDGTPIFGYLHYTRKAETTSTFYDQDGNLKVWNDLTLYRTILDDLPNYCEIRTWTSETKASATATLTFGGTIIDLVTQTISENDTVYELAECLYGPPIGIRLKRIINLSQSRNETKIINIDMKNNFCAAFNKSYILDNTIIRGVYDIDKTWVEPDNVTYTHPDLECNLGEQFAWSVVSNLQNQPHLKKINATTLSSYSTPPANYDIAIQDVSYYLDILSDVPMKANHVIGYDYFGPPEHAKHPITGDELTVWKHDSTQPTYINFNGSDGIPLIWQGGPLIPPQSTTLIPSNVRLV